MKKRILVSSLLLSLGVIIPFLVLFSVLSIPAGETSESWFQRSGSILVILSIVAEIVMVVEINELSKLTAHWKLSANVLVLLTPILAIIGTLFWGYGDLLA